jgi:hypothetical protein
MTLLQCSSLFIWTLQSALADVSKLSRNRDRNIEKVPRWMCRCLRLPLYKPKWFSDGTPQEKPIYIEIFIHSLNYINIFLILYMKCAGKLLYVLQWAANQKSLRTTALYNGQLEIFIQGWNHQSPKLLIYFHIVPMLRIHGVLPSCSL